MFAISFLNNKCHPSVGNTRRRMKNGFYSSPMRDEKPRLDHVVREHGGGLPAMKKGSQFFKPPRQAKCISVAVIILNASSSLFVSTILLFVCVGFGRLYIKFSHI